ncbi:dentilisin complex subunit PrcA [Treponema sp. OMZ 792]|uniref:dentilisin complex subunit PrcA n=1 Tax=unclassified Treponema TaxID=2638727 RepID=UPI0020A32B4F|nr:MULTISPECIES: dentilisin complex subunit PrcA [unclassified Treponema]UTC75200.1 dentilisin complex subunit PrcA [Treponema sp. OMZ 792]UTC79207.1 dentilisin complex subunit PrcA [Treponema sp. OMZ 798]
MNDTNFYNPEQENSSLKSLKITETPGFIFDGTKTEYHNIPVPYGEVHITAEAYTGAEVKIDGKVSTDPGYGTVAISAAKLQVLVEVIKGGNSKIYSLNFVEAGATVTVEVLVVDSIGGTKVSGTTLKVFDPAQVAGAAPVKTVQVNNGIANITGLEPDKRYDFKLEGIEKKWAGSLIENYYVSALKNQKLTMIQFPHGDHTRGVEPPKVASIMKAAAAGGGETPINDGSSIDNSLKSIKVNFTSSVGAVEAKDGNGFGAKVGMGMIPNDLSGIYGSYFGTEFSAGTFTSKYEFELKPGTGDFIFPNGNFDLIVVGYDIANNRVEKHISIKSENSASGAPLDNAVFKNILIIVERIPYSANIYSNDGGDITHINLMGGSVNGNIIPLALDPIGGHSSSYTSIIQFNLAGTGGKSVPIIGFDFYRKKAGTEDKFERVSRTIYGKPMVETFPGANLHQGFDTDSRLEENVEYEYKVIAYNASHTVESPVLKMKVMEAFTYELTAPANRVLISKADAQNMSYTCKISNPKLLKKDEADCFDSGLLVVDGRGKVLFGSKFQYYYNRTYKDGNSGPDLLIDLVQNGSVYRKVSYQDILKGQLAQPNIGVNSLEDLIKVNSSTREITLTPKFTQIGFFNVEEYSAGQPLTYTAGTTYQWDIQDWGDDAYDLNDDSPLMVIKDHTYVNLDGTIGMVQIQTFGNTYSNGANAVNGRFTFTVTE